MKTKINIGTNKKNFQGVVVDKDFDDITIDDVREIVRAELGDVKGLMVFGWADVTDGGCSVVGR
jgi:hypothetical protein